MALEVAQSLQRNCPEEFSTDPHVDGEIKQEEENSESQEFLKGVGGSNRHLYVSLTNDKSGNQNHSPRLFHLTSLSGTFTSTEIAAPCRSNKIVVPHPFQQSHLYGASQPG